MKHVKKIACLTDQIRVKMTRIEQLQNRLEVALRVVDDSRKKIEETEIAIKSFRDEIASIEAGENQ